jgi:hypothetical protein
MLTFYEDVRNVCMTESISNICHNFGTFTYSVQSYRFENPDRTVSTADWVGGH